MPAGSKGGNSADAHTRLAEIGEILALGLLRLKAGQSSGTCPDAGESSLASAGLQSGHDAPFVERGVDE